MTHMTHKALGIFQRAKKTGTGELDFMGHMGHLDRQNKSLACNIRAEPIPDL